MPRDLLPRLLAHLDEPAARRCVILSGGIGAGKTRTAETLARDLAAHGVSVGGVLAPRVLSDGETIGYRILDLLTGEERPFARLEPPGVSVGRFFVSEGSLRFALAAIERATKEARVVFADEVGRWELGGGGLSPAVRSLLASLALPVLLVRSEFVAAVVQAFSLEEVDQVELEGAHAS